MWLYRSDVCCCNFFDFVSNAPRWPLASHFLTYGKALNSLIEGPMRLTNMRLAKRSIPSRFVSGDEILFIALKPSSPSAEVTGIVSIADLRLWVPQDLPEMVHFFINKIPQSAACLVVVDIQSMTVFLPRDARSAKRGIAIVSRPSVCLSVCLSVTLTYAEHIGWISSN